MKITNPGNPAEKKTPGINPEFGCRNKFVKPSE
jgi:hypothetical protein